jgi:hypothetical protein
MDGKRALEVAISVLKQIHTPTGRVEETEAAER